jgi:hypothetical protein
MADVEAPEPSGDSFTNLVALTIAILASFIALSAIKSGNVAEAMQQAQAERNNGWAWYQAVRVREDMATYEMANLERLKRIASAAEVARLEPEIAAQDAEIGRIRGRLGEVKARAEGAEKEYNRLNTLADHYDFSDALIAITVTLLAVAALAKLRWLFGFALLPGFAGMAFALAAMFHRPFDMKFLFAWLG